jgi:hypothetical protein
MLGDQVIAEDDGGLDGSYLPMTEVKNWIRVLGESTAESHQYRYNYYSSQGMYKEV